ncbi:MAG: potassium channel family protein [Acidimicrobiales bacterium]
MSNLDRLWDWVSQRNDGRTVGGSASSVLVIGLGRFGTALASTLVDMELEVMAIDTDQLLVNQWADRLTHVRVADGTSAAALGQIGASGFDVAVVAIGTDIEASILSVSALADIGVHNIWAKAITSEHGRILERVGAHHVVYPEAQMGQRVAHAVSGQVLDYFILDEGFVLAELNAPPDLLGKTLAEADLRRDFAVTVVCVKPLGGSFTYATADTVLGEGDLVLVAGTVSDTERFARFAAG